MFKERKELLKEIEKQFNAKSLLYVTSDRRGLETQIARDVFDYFVNHLDTIGVVDRICFIIYSRGGDTLSAWSIINLVRQYCNNLISLVPSRAHSAATLMCLGANEIIMTKQAPLGPIDPSVNGPLNPQVPGESPKVKSSVSVEGINGFLELAHEQNINDSNEMLQILLHLAEQVHPLVLGDVFRIRTQIRMLAKKLITNQVTDEEAIKKILEFMCSESGSHDYTINRREAKNELGLNITKPNDDQYQIIKKLYDDFANELELTEQFDPRIYMGTDNEKDYSFKRGLIESVEYGSHFFLSKGKFIKHQQSIEQIKMIEGWKYGD